VDWNGYFLELGRYLVLNPVRASVVKHPKDWRWSSYGAMVGTVKSPAWLTTDVFLEEFGKSRTWARKKYQQFVEEGMGVDTIWKNLRGQIYLGDDGFVEQMQEKLGKRNEDVNIPQAQQRSPPVALEEIRRRYSNRDRGIRAAYETGGYSYQEIAKCFGVHFTTVGRIVRESRKSKNTGTSKE
jgi:hypothetical protein